MANMVSAPLRANDAIDMNSKIGSFLQHLKGISLLFLEWMGQLGLCSIVLLGRILLSS